MSQDLPIPRQDGSAGRREPATDGPSGPAEAPQSADGTTVVSWGERPDGPRRVSLALGRLGRDSRLVPVVGAVGAAVVFASVVGDWTVTTIPTEGAQSDTPVELASGLAEVGSFGAAYLVGVLGVVGCLALVLFGSPAVRQNARVLGLAFTGVIIGLLFAVTGSLEAPTEIWELYGEIEGLDVRYGQGLVLAYLGVGTLGVALVLAGRFVRPPAGAAGGTGPSTGQAAAVTAAGSDWPWRRPRAAAGRELDDPDDGDSGPIDLTVTPTKPFTH